jgi:ribonuclease M5
VEGAICFENPPLFLTKARLYQDGLTGGKSSAVRRKRLLAQMGLPQKLSTNRFLEVCNALLTEEEYCRYLQGEESVV